PAGDRPAPRLVLAQDEDDASVRARDDGVGGRQWIATLLAHGVTSPEGVTGWGADAFCSMRPFRACVKRARQNGLRPSFSSARETARAVRAASSRFSEARMWAISTSRFAYRARRAGVKYA